MNDDDVPYPAPYGMHWELVQGQWELRCNEREWQPSHWEGRDLDD